AVSAVFDPEAHATRAVAYWRLSCGNQNRGLWLVYDPETGCVAEDQAGAIAALRYAAVLPEQEAPTALIDNARRACFHYARSAIARLEAARIAGDALHPNLPQCRIAAWINQGFTATRDRLSRHERAALDRLLQRLACRFTVSAERSLAAVLQRLPDRPDLDSLDLIDKQLRALEPGGGDRVDLSEVALLVLLAPPG
ncbi:MAG TPA: hypothetical protein VLC48_10640, partial [Gemmatimonadota bacterium]|nr:hypothetical protein [Gemmatimonadota bacterium]